MTEYGVVGQGSDLGALSRLLLGVAYDGTGFHGFAPQPGQRTVAGSLATALSNVFGGDPHLVCAGRTDAGVHARTQVVHVDVPSDVLKRRYGADENAFDFTGLVRSLSHQLGPEIAIWRAVLAPEGFDARHSAIWRRYRYALDCSGRPDPVRAGSVWAIEEDLDLAAMRLGAYPLIGEHDFAAFCRQREGMTGPITRRVLAVGFRETEDAIVSFEITANAFCHQMVRSIVGMLVAIGRGKASAPDVVSMLRSGSRAGAPTIAPAKGLTLVAVGYPEELGGPWS